MFTLKDFIQYKNACKCTTQGSVVESSVDIMTRYSAETSKLPLMVLMQYQAVIEEADTSRAYNVMIKSKDYRKWRETQHESLSNTA